VSQLKASRVLVAIVVVDALIMALGHAPLALGLSTFFRPPSLQPSRPQTGQTAVGPAFPFSAIGDYFLIATVVYILGAAFVLSRRLFKLANIGLIVLAVVDNVLLIYTRTMPNIFLGRIISWSTGWFPLGTVQILMGQTGLIVLCAILLYKPSFAKL
jgi:hypothetical protein